MNIFYEKKGNIFSFLGPHWNQYPICWHFISWATLLNYMLCFCKLHKLLHQQEKGGGGALYVCVCVCVIFLKKVTKPCNPPKSKSLLLYLWYHWKALEETMHVRRRIAILGSTKQTSK